MIIFGASGDLTKRKLLPSLYNLAKNELLPEKFAVVGVARQEMSEGDFHAKIEQDIHEFATEEVKPEVWNWLDERISYISGDFGDDATFQNLEAKLKEVCAARNIPENFFYYMATAPEFFAPIVAQLDERGLARESQETWRRFVFEKPFGHDLDSARQLNFDLRQILKERQIYRIDHYLGKETVQNLIVFRFANGIFEPIWNRNFIDHVQITVAETVGVEGRGGYYEQAGALRDMIPNHIFQLLTLIAMEAPASFDADAVRDEQSKVLRAINIFEPEDVLKETVRGQYGEGVSKGAKLPAYRAEEKVSPDSRTETFVAMRVLVDNWRWADVPFYLRTGKRLPKRVSEISVQFKKPPHSLFRDTAVENLRSNRLIIRIQPNEGITLRFGAKIPGQIMQIGAVNMEFDYADYFGNSSKTGYETLLYDCMNGDATRFQRADMVEAAWSVVTPILDVWKALPVRNFPNYEANTWGPEESDELLRRDGRSWRNE